MHIIEVKINVVGVNNYTNLIKMFDLYKINIDSIILKNIFQHTHVQVLFFLVRLFFLFFSIKGIIGFFKTIFVVNRKANSDIFFSLKRLRSVEHISMRVFTSSHRFVSTLLRRPNICTCNISQGKIP